MAWLRSLFFGNFLLKMFALILAVTLYIQIHKDTLVRVTTVEAKLILKYPRALILTSGPIPGLKVTLQGPDTILKRSATKNWRYTLNLSDALPGSMQTELYTEQLRKIFPVELRVIRVQPSLLDLTFAKLGKRTLPIRVPTRGKPLFGYRLIQIQPFPRVVAVEGPAAIINRLKSIPTTPIDLRGKYRDQTVLVKLHKPEKNMRFVGPHKAKVSLTFLQRKIKRIIKKVPIRLLNFFNTKMDTKLSPIHANITLIGPQAQLFPLKGKDLVVTIDGSKLTNKPAGIHKLPLRVKAPNPDLKVIKTEPQEVSVTTTLRPGQPPTRKKKVAPRLNDDDDDTQDDVEDKPKKRKHTKRTKRRHRKHRRRRKKRKKHRKRRHRKHRSKKRKKHKRRSKRRHRSKTGSLHKRRKRRRSTRRLARSKHSRFKRKAVKIKQPPSARSKAPPPVRRRRVPARRANEKSSLRQSKRLGRRVAQQGLKRSVLHKQRPASTAPYTKR